MIANHHRGCAVVYSSLLLLGLLLVVLLDVLFVGLFLLGLALLLPLSLASTFVAASSPAALARSG